MENTNVKVLNTTTGKMYVSGPVSDDAWANIEMSAKSMGWKILLNDADVDSDGENWDVSYTAMELLKIRNAFKDYNTNKISIGIILNVKSGWLSFLDYNPVKDRFQFAYNAALAEKVGSYVKYMPTTTCDSMDFHDVMKWLANSVASPCEMYDDCYKLFSAAFFYDVEYIKKSFC